MDGHGVIAIKTSQSPEFVIVEITDNGPGIPFEIQNKIFDPFFTTKSPGEGTGLGLNISHSIITQQHRGRISVNSQSGETCFRIELPLNYEKSNLGE